MTPFMRSLLSIGGSYQMTRPNFRSFDFFTGKCLGPGLHAFRMSISAGFNGLESISQAFRRR